MGDGSHLSQQIALAAMTRRQRTRVDRLSRHSARRAELNPLDQRIIAPLQAVIEQDHRIDGERNRCPLPGAQLLHLRVEALAVGRYSCIAQNHGMILLLYSAHEKPFFINGIFYVRKSLNSAHQPKQGCSTLYSESI